MAADLVNYQPEGMQSALARLLAAKIDKLGYRPFLAVGLYADGWLQALLCPTPDAAGAFVGEVEAAAGDMRSGFVAGLAAALAGEVYDAGTLWFDWVGDPDDRLEAVVATSALSDASSANPGYCPLLYLVERDGGRADPEARIAALAQLLDGCRAGQGGNGAPQALLEGLGLALSKQLGMRGRCPEALTHVGRVLRQVPASIHLKAAENALERRLAAEPVPDRLVKFIGADNGSLRPRICELPFTRFDIGPDGDVRLCCGHWLPNPIGNIITSTTEEVLNSPMAQKIRASMLDGSFKYCNHLECGAMVQDTLPFQDNVAEPALRAAIDAGELTLDGVKDLTFAFDQTCNLSCPSCRTHRIVEKPSQNEAKAEAVARNVLPLLPRARSLHINPAGELLASKSSRRLLELVSRETCPDLRLDIISNGTLFSELEWQKFPNIHDMVRSIRISVDGCTKETFESLRRLGDFEVFCQNMEFLGRLRAQGVLPELKFSFTYQLGNFREMRDFVFFARRYNCDFVIFERLQNLGAFSNEEYRARAVHLSDHPLHPEFLEMIRDPVFRAPCVWHEFEWEGAVDHHPFTVREAWYRKSLEYAGQVFAELL